MSLWVIIGIIVLVLGIIISNLMLLKHSARHSFGSSLTKANQSSPSEDTPPKSDNNAPPSSDQ